MKTLQLITGLTTGGAEMMLYKVISGLKKRNHNSLVISLGEEGKISELIQEQGIPVRGLGLLRSKIPSLNAVLNMLKISRQAGHELVQGWMYHGNLAALMCGNFSGKRTPVVWNVRQTLYDIQKEKKLTQWVIKANAFFSKYADVIIYNSKLSASQHESFGFIKSKTFIIPNGFDTEVFTPSEKLKTEVRAELNISPDELIIGLVGRYHPMKDHQNLIRAAKILAEKHPGLKFVLIGSGVTKENSHLFQQIADSGLTDSFHLLGERQDIPRLTSAFDVAVSSSSWGEGFPNVLGEAMSCAVPCVATNVGDSNWVVGDTGVIVPPNDSPALSSALENLIKKPELRKELGIKARQRIIEHFSLNSIIDQYESLYRSLLK